MPTIAIPTPDINIKPPTSDFKLIVTDASNKDNSASDPDRNPDTVYLTMDNEGKAKINFEVEVEKGKDGKNTIEPKDITWRIVGTAPASQGTASGSASSTSSSSATLSSVASTLVGTDNVTESWGTTSGSASSSSSSSSSETLSSVALTLVGTDNVTESLHNWNGASSGNFATNPQSKTWTKSKDTKLKNSYSFDIIAEATLNGKKITRQVRAMILTESVVILIHGVSSGADAYNDFYKFARNDLPDTTIVPFVWGPDNMFQASNGVGLRTNWFEGLSDKAWAAVDRIHTLIPEIRKKLPANGKITIFSHSQGTIVSLAALQEGTKVDNWVLMGSPLSQGNVETGGENTNFAAAVGNVTNTVINFASKEDGTVWKKWGWAIGRHGLPNNILVLPKVKQYVFMNVDHYGDDGWWALRWLENEGNAFSAEDRKFLTNLLNGNDR